MEEPARKRRRTNSPEQHDNLSSPLKKPPRRPSFASPTKSSLARNYPNVLRATSAASPAVRPSHHDDGTAQDKQARTLALDGRDDRDRIFRAERKLRRRSVPRDGQESNAAERAATPAAQARTTQDGRRPSMLLSSPSKRPRRVPDPEKQSHPAKKAQPAQEDGLAGAVDDGPVAQHEPPDMAPIQQPPDPELETRKQEKARLQREIEWLESQVTRCTEEIIKEQQRAPDQLLQGAERDDLLNFILSVSGVDTKQDKPAPVSSLLCSFLPFSAFPVPKPRSNQPEPPIPSHRPLDLTDPMPYLEMFTSLQFSTQLSLPRGKVFPSSNRVHQKHTIDISGPHQLLTAQLSVLLDALAHQIIDLHILRISPWAERELGVFLLETAAHHDLGNACWAIDSYWELAHRRAQHWHACESAFAHLLPSNDSIPAPPAAPTPMARKHLTRHLGRDTLVLQDAHVLLKLQWKISFSWTGEAESLLSVEPALPLVWAQADTNASFAKIPETFALLVRSKGALGATKIIAALLFGP